MTLVVDIPNGTTVDSALLQYRLVHHNALVNYPWGNIYPITFPFAITPDITELGNYELRVSITTDFGDTSLWSQPVPFQVSANCGGDDDGDGDGNTSNLFINSSVPNNNSGTLDFGNGEPNEVLDLSFHFTTGTSGAINFGSGITVDSIDTLHTDRVGTAQLNASGNLTTSFAITFNSNCVITIIGRSSTLPIGGINITHINNS